MTATALQGIDVAAPRGKPPNTPSTSTWPTAIPANVSSSSSDGLSHFAVDPDVVWMTTRLDGNKTFFLPFNKGNGTRSIC